MDRVVNNFDIVAAEKIKEIEKTTNHDLKSVEYYIKNNIHHYKEHIHFCCTSEDINNLAYALMLKQALHSVFIPKIDSVVNNLIQQS